MEGTFDINEVSEEGVQALQNYIKRNHISNVKPEETMYAALPSMSPYPHFIAAFTGEYTFRPGTHVFTCVCWQDEKTWRVVRVNEFFVSALAGMQKQVMKTWPVYRNSED